MANQKISTYLTEALALTDEDLIDISKEISPAVYDTQRVKFSTLTSAISSVLVGRTQEIGVAIDFEDEKVYNTATAPETGNIVFSQTNAVLGIVQKIYHDHSVAPTFTGVPDVQLVGDGVYFTNELNIIYAEWTQADRVEYWIVQEQ